MDTNFVGLVSKAGSCFLIFSAITGDSLVRRSPASEARGVGGSLVPAHSSLVLTAAVAGSAVSLVLYQVWQLALLWL